MNAPARSITICLTGVVLAVAFGAAALADPLPGEVRKFVQRPMINTTINNQVYHGHDEASTLYATDIGTNTRVYSGVAMADDFADAFDTPVVHIRWWGSYLENFVNPDSPVNQFLIAFESDIPADDNPAGFSTPGEVLSSQVVRRGPLSPGSGTFTEKLVFDAPDGFDDIYEYNAELHLGKEFPQEPETVYWLKIAALVNPTDATLPPVRWGWHNRDYTTPNPLALAVTPPVSPGERNQQGDMGIDYPTPIWHFQDDAVSAQTQVFIDSAMPSMPLEVLQTGYQPQNYVAFLDGPGSEIDAAGNLLRPGIDLFSKDLAFELYTRPIPEPAASTLALLASLTAIGWLRFRWG